MVATIFPLQNFRKNCRGKNSNPKQIEFTARGFVGNSWIDFCCDTFLLNKMNTCISQYSHCAICIQGTWQCWAWGHDSPPNSWGQLSSSLASYYKG